MNYRYFICDVFTDKKFCGNQLAVLPEAEGLSNSQMQQIAREFNFSESAFVFSPELGQTRKVRIFTPTEEVPFAGHPNIGTAFVLAKDGAFGDFREPVKVIFEEKVGFVPITIRYDAGNQIWCELSAPEELSIGDSVPTEFSASLLSLDTGDIVTTTHPPQVASVGLPFLFIELSSLDVLQRAKVNMPQFNRLIDRGIVTYIHMYVKRTDDFDIRARMFAPIDGVPEDPATGSANCALIALLTYYDSETDTDNNWRISQGIEVGRPSVLNGRTEKRNGKITGVWIGGNSVLISEGIIEM
ncbi:MAG: PhzF family phenazine biosynthesis protein [SAR202 cluster bacterium]|nr:PhzF family phenazine biosynthesis protein [SAR202 cluster bacterium]